MARIFITGSTDGLGLLATKELIRQGHQVVLHARNQKRKQEVLPQVPGAEAILVADLASIEETKQLAADLNASGRFDAVIHNAGVYHASSANLLAINTLAPYVLTSLIHPPDRLIYLSSGMHRGGDPGIAKIQSNRTSYSDTKLHLVLLMKAVARYWPRILANAVDPGWVPTKMGGRGAPDDLNEGFQTQVWLAVSEDPAAKVSGRYFYHRKVEPFVASGDQLIFQEELLDWCASNTGVRFPRHFD